LVLAVAAGVLIFGGPIVGSMPVDVLPEFAPVFVEVQTEALGLSAPEVEMLVTLNIEELLMGTPWVETMRSDSVPGLSSVVLVFEPRTDPMLARQLVQERLNLAWGLPNVSKPPVIMQPLSSTNRVMMIGLDSEVLSSIEMSVLARWNIRPALMGVEGVANVSIWGQRKRQLQVQVDPERLRSQGVTLDQIIRTAGDSLWVSPLTFLNASTSGSGGWIDTPQQRLTIRHVLPISEPDDLARVAVADTEGQRLSDVAEVVEDHQPLIGDARLSRGPGLLLVVEKFPGANTLVVTRAVEQQLDALRPGLGGINMDTTVFRPATFVEMAIDNLSTTLLLASLLVALALGLLFLSWRVALISLVTIPLSLVAALLVLHQLGATVNSMVLAGLVPALGVVIDDALVDVGYIARRLRQHRKASGDQRAFGMVLAASSEVRGTVVFGTLVAALVVAPAFFLEEPSGLFYRPLALSYLLALAASTLVALTVTPAMSMLLLGNAPPESRSWGFAQRLLRAYEAALCRSVSKPRLALMAVTAVVVSSLAILPFLRLEPVPAFRERDIMIQWDCAPGTSHPEMTRIADRVGRELQSIPGVRNFATHLGRAVLGDEVVGISSGELWVSVDPAADYGATLGKIRETVSGYPGVAREVRTFLRDTLALLETGSSRSMVVRVYGREFDALGTKAEEVRQALLRIDGVVDPAVEPRVEEPYVEIQVDLAKAKQYGVKPGDVRRAASTLLGGIEVGSLFEDQKVFDVVVWGVPESRHSLTSVRELLIDIPGGGHVRLEEVADVRVTSSLTSIKREAISRRLDVGFEVRGRSLHAVARDVERSLEPIEFPRESHAELLGRFAQRRTARFRTLVAAIGAAVGVFLLLQAPFDSWRLAALTVVSVLAGLTGGVLAAAALGSGEVSLGELVGLVMVTGIAVRNCVLLIGRYQQLEQQEGETFGLALVLRGSRDQAAPIVMTVLATGLALLPFAVVGSIAGHEIVHPMAVVALAGLGTSTLLNLFVVPALYLRVGGMGMEASKPG
jgi:CzcA family heavy metal efflux pump